MSSVTQKTVLNSVFQVFGTANYSTSSATYVSTGQLGITVSPLITGRFYVSMVVFVTLAAAATIGIAIYSVAGASIPGTGSAVTGSQTAGIEAAPTAALTLTCFTLASQITIGTVTSFYMAIKTSASSLTVYRDSGATGTQATSLFGMEV